VRLFEKADAKQNAGAASPSSHDRDPEGRQVNDENVYPGSVPNDGRRKSALRQRRLSSGREVADYNIEDGVEMDLDDTIANPDIYLSSDDTDALNEAFDEVQVAEQTFDNDLDHGSIVEGDDGDAMDVTQAINGDILRRRSSTGDMIVARKRRSSAAFTVYQDNDSSQQETIENFAGRPSLAFTESQDMSMTGSFADITTSSNQSAPPTEYTVPLAQALNPPRPPSQEWLALAAATHSGEIAPPSDDSRLPTTAMHMATDDDTGMSLDDALTRLQKARDSMGAHSTISIVDSDMDIDGETRAFPQNLSEEDQSFSSSEDSFAIDGGDKTFNLTSVMHRASSLGGELARALATPRRSTLAAASEELMETTDVLGNTHPYEPTITSRNRRSSAGATMELTSVATGVTSLATETLSASGPFNFPPPVLNQPGRDSPVVFSAPPGGTNSAFVSREQSVARPTSNHLSTVFARREGESSNLVLDNNSSASSIMADVVAASENPPPDQSSSIGSRTVFTKSVVGGTFSVHARHRAPLTSPAKKGAGPASMLSTARRNSTAAISAVVPGSPTSGPSSVLDQATALNALYSTNTIPPMASTQPAGETRQEPFSTNPVVTESQILTMDSQASVISEPAPPLIDEGSSQAIPSLPSNTQGNQLAPDGHAKESDSSQQFALPRRRSSIAVPSFASPKPLTPSKNVGRPSARPSNASKARFSLLPGLAPRTPDRLPLHQPSPALSPDQGTETNVSGPNREFRQFFKSVFRRKSPSMILSV
jgi:hypothetical protein